jgi:serine protease Do
MNGEVVGINTAIVSSGQGIGFAIPINLAQGIISQLKSQGEVTSGWLGVSIQDLSPELAEYYRIKEKQGVLVTEVFPNDPAARAGVQAGDVVIAVDGKPVSTSRELSAVIANLPVGHSAGLAIVRQGDKKTIEVKLAKRADAVAAPARSQQDQGDDWGLTVVELTPEITRQFGFEDNESGILVTGVSGNSPAEKAGVQRGDLIKEMDHKPVRDIQAFKAMMEKVKQGQSTSLLVQRPREGLKVLTLTR